MPEVDGEEGVGAIYEGWGERGEGAGEEVEVWVEGFGEGED